MDNMQASMVPTNAQVAAVPVPKSKNNDLIKTVVIVGLGLLALTFICLFVWILVQYNIVNDNVDGKIDLAVAAAKEEQQMEDEKEFAEREKDPYQNFAGPVDYGELSFKYPRTWSVYVAKDASSGGDFEAYLNPRQVDPITKDSIYALRVTIRAKDFESVAAEYQRELDRKGSNLSVETINVGGAIANRYTGTIPRTDLNGVIVILKIRDKTAILQTDSVLFRADFDKLLETVSFNA